MIATVEATKNEAAAGGGEGPYPEQVTATADSDALAEQNENLASNTG